jgi:hypothetical protein
LKIESQPGAGTYITVEVPFADAGHPEPKELTISAKTVKSHVSNILSKLHVDDHTQAAIYALRKGLGPKE